MAHYALWSRRKASIQPNMQSKTDGDSRMSDTVNSLYCPASNQALTCLKASQFLIKLKCLHHWHVRKKCGIKFNQISCASFIDCLMEIMNHSTSASTPTVIWRTSRSAPHCQSPSDVKSKCVKDTETDRSEPNMCGRHRSVTGTRRSFHREDLFN